MADILITVGAKGEFAVGGESGRLIKKQLEAQLKNGINIKVGIDEKQALKSLQAQLDRVSKKLRITVGASEAAGANSPLAQTDGIEKNTAARQNNARAAREQATASNDQAAALLKEQKITAEAIATIARFGAKLQTIKPPVLKDFAPQISAINEQLIEAAQGGEDAAQVLAGAKNGIKSLNASFKALGAEGGNVFTYLHGKIKSFAVYLLSSAITIGVVSGFKNAVAAVEDLNAAMTNLQIVTGKSHEKTAALLKDYNALAQEIGSTTLKISEGAQDWLRQGYSIEDTRELLRQSMSLSIMGNMSAEDATTSLTAALKGYQLQVEEASDVVDKFFAVDMAAATSSSKLAEALAKTAANAKLAGLDLNDVIGQLAVVNETMQEGGEQTGTFYNTMLSRMGALKAGRLSDPETEEDLSDVESTLRGLGIQLRTSDSEFRNFGDVLDEVAGKWDSFSSVQQRAIATAFSGTRQQTRFLSLMQGYEQAAEYSEEAANSFGVATQKMGIYEESLEAKANRMAAAFEKMSSSLIKDEWIAFFYDLGAGLFNLGSTLGALPARIIAIAAALISLKGALDALRISSFGTSVQKTLKDLGWPVMTGDKYGIIVPSHSKEAA